MPHIRGGVRGGGVGGVQQHLVFSGGRCEERAEEQEEKNANERARQHPAAAAPLLHNLGPRRLPQLTPHTGTSKNPFL